MPSPSPALVARRRTFFSALLLALLAALSPLRAADSAGAFLKAEHLGGLRLGTAEKDVLTLLGQPEKKSGLVLQEADGTFVQTWEYPAKGLSIVMSAGGKKTGAKTIAAITASVPCALATKAGIKLGSAAAEVRQAYAGHADKENPPTAEQFTVGSIYGGIIFNFEKGKVSRIFFGAAAE